MRRVKRIASATVLAGALGALAARVNFRRMGRLEPEVSLADYVIPHEGREGEVGLREAADIVAIERVWSAYTHYLDSGDAEGVASLFTPTGGYVLGYANREAETVEPLGYSPSADGVSGTPGGGCTALGHDAIVHFLEGIGKSRTKFPGLSKHVVVDKWIHVRGDTATMRAYWLGESPIESKGLYNNTFVRTSMGWKVHRNEVLFDADLPTFPCRN